MHYTFKVSEDHLKPFFRSIITHSNRILVKEWLESAGMDWESYWLFPLDARPWFIKAMVWAEIKATPSQILKILLEEKRQSSKSVLLKYRTIWWMGCSYMTEVMTEVYKQMNQEGFLKLVKICPYEVLESCKEEYLPLAMAIPKIANTPWLKAVITERLKRS